MGLPDLQQTLIGLLGMIVAGLLGWRGANHVKNQNAEANRNSVFEDDKMKRIELLEGRISEIRRERDEYAEQLRAAKARLEVMQLMSSGDAAGALRLAQDSGFVDFERPLRARQATSRPSPSDVFQAADPYGPKPKPRPKK